MNAPLSEDGLLTYEEWQALGMQVMARQKSIGRNAAGKAVFAESQVYDPNGWMAESEELFYWDDPK